MMTFVFIIPVPLSFLPVVIDARFLGGLTLYFDEDASHRRSEEEDEDDEKNREEIVSEMNGYYHRGGNFWGKVGAHNGKLFWHRFLEGRFFFSIYFNDLFPKVNDYGKEKNKYNSLL